MIMPLRKFEPYVTFIANPIIMVDTSEIEGQMMNGSALILLRWRLETFIPQAKRETANLKSNRTRTPQYCI